MKILETRAARLWLGGLTWLLVAYVVGFVGIVCWMMFSGATSLMERVFPYIFLVHFIAMLLGMALLVAYILDVVNNPRVPPDKRVMWVLIIFLGSFIGMLLYWFSYLRHGSDEPA